MRRAVALVAVSAVTLAAAASASAHAHISPPVALAQAGQLFTLDVPTEKQGVRTTKIVLTVPSGFSIDSFVDAPGWQRQVQSTGSGDAAVIQSVTWSGGSVPTGEDAVFHFVAEPSSAGDAKFTVKQTYGSGKVVEWSGAESSDTPAPIVHVVDSVGGGGGSNTLAIIALVVGALGLLVGLAALFGRKRAVA